MKKGILKSVLILLAISVMGSGCKKNNTDDLETDLQVSRDNATSQNMTDDVLQQIDDAAMRTTAIDPQSNLNTSGSCPTITVATTNGNWPKTVTIDYGITNCIGNGNVLRRGKIIATFTGPYRQASTVITIGFDNYFVNDNQITGSKTITNLGNNAANQMQWNIIVNQLKITRPDGSFITWDANRTRTWVLGQNTTQVRNDDAFEITGTLSGSNSNAQSFAANITLPLYVAWVCNYIEAGTIEVTPTGKATRTINFGTAGVCDNQATLTVNGNNYNITLKP